MIRFNERGNETGRDSRRPGTGALLSSIHETQAHEGNRVKEPYRNSARHAFALLTQRLFHPR
jgi:hypothetical protein